MGIIVQKYGGTSVAGAEKIKNVAKRIIAKKSEGNELVVVVSAAGGVTDELLKKAREISDNPPERELDQLLSTGEQVSIALLSIALHEQGCDAISFTGPQVGIVTDSIYTKAKIKDIRTGRISEELKNGKVVIVAGFQGVTEENDITTLGRGGSDTTAVALAARLGASECEIYTDVEGVFTADPRLVTKARKLDAVTYDEMLEMAATGAKVMQLRSVEMGKRHGVVIHVRSSFSNEKGTIIREEGEEMEEKAIISAVTHDESEAKITIRDVPDRPGIAARVFRALADVHINVDMIIQNISEEDLTDISFTTGRTELGKVKTTMEQLVNELGARKYEIDEDIAKVSLIGAGMRSNPGVAADMFAALAEKNINIEMISTSEIKISCVVEASRVKEAVSAVHAKFRLE